MKYREQKWLSRASMENDMISLVTFFIYHFQASQCLEFQKPPYYLVTKKPNPEEVSHLTRNCYGRSTPLWAFVPVFFLSFQNNSCNLFSPILISRRQEKLKFLIKPWPEAVTPVSHSWIILLQDIYFNSAMSMTY